MGQLQRRGRYCLGLAFLAFACLSLPSGTIVTATDRPTAAKPPADAVAAVADGGATSAPRATAKSRSADKKGRPEAVKKNKARKGSSAVATIAGKQGADDGSDGPDPELVTKVMAIQDRNTEALTSQKGIAGTATGLDDDGNVVIRVYTTGADNPQIPATLEGIPVQTVLTGPVFHCGSPSAAATTVPAPTAYQARPVPIGTSSMANALISANTCGSATLGCRIVDKKNVVYALSCNHVYALENKARIGTQASQPSPGEIGCQIVQADDIGPLAGFVSISFSRFGSNTVDCAAVKTSTSLVGNSTLSNGYGTPRKTTAAAFLGQQVQKYGRTSGQTQGMVNGVNVTVVVGYDSGIAMFRNQIEVAGVGVSQFGIPGDSGSLVVDSQNHPVGLFFAGGGGASFANPINLVLQQLGNVLKTTLTIDGN